MYKTDSGSGEDRLLDPLEKIFMTEETRIGHIENHGTELPFYSEQVVLHLLLDASRARLEFRRNNNTEVFTFGISSGDMEKDTNLSTYFQNEKKNGTNILLLKEEVELIDIQQCIENGTEWELRREGKILIGGIHLAMNFRQFSEVIAEDISFGDYNASILRLMLNDTRGAFQLSGVTAIRPFLQNYEKLPDQQADTKTSDWVELRILYDKRLETTGEHFEHIIQKLREENIFVRTLRWGETLFEETPEESPVLLMLEWDIVKRSISLDCFCNALRRNHYRNTYALFHSEAAYNYWGTDDPRFQCAELRHSCQIQDTEKIVREISDMVRTYMRKRYLIGISYAHDKVMTGKRPTVSQLEKIVELLNIKFGESAILFDQNPSSYKKFDGNGALPRTLELYRECDYYVVLDDRYYDDSYACNREGKVIKEKLDSGLQPGHLYFLHPENDTHCCLFSENMDYSTIMQLCENNTEEIVQNIIKRIENEQ